MTHRFCTFRPPLDRFVHPPNWLWKNEQLCKQIVWKYDSPKNATYEIQNRSRSIHSLQKMKNGKVKGKKKSALQERTHKFQATIKFQRN
jgi:hypothetical protein